MRICSQFRRELHEIALVYYNAKSKVVANIKIPDDDRMRPFELPLGSLKLPQWSHAQRILPDNDSEDQPSDDPPAQSSQLAPAPIEVPRVPSPVEFATMDDESDVEVAEMMEQSLPSQSMASVSNEDLDSNDGNVDITEDIPRYDDHPSVEIASANCAPNAAPSSNEGLEDSSLDNSEELMVRFASRPKPSTPSINGDITAANNILRSPPPRPRSSPQKYEPYFASLMRSVIATNASTLADEIVSTSPLPSQNASRSVTRPIDDSTHSRADSAPISTMDEAVAVFIAPEVLTDAPEGHNQSNSSTQSSTLNPSHNGSTSSMNELQGAMEAVIVNSISLGGSELTAQGGVSIPSSAELSPLAPASEIQDEITSISSLAPSTELRESIPTQTLSESENIVPIVSEPTAELESDPIQEALLSLCTTNPVIDILPDASISFRTAWPSPSASTPRRPRYEIESRSRGTSTQSLFRVPTSLIPRNADNYEGFERLDSITLQLQKSGSFRLPQPIFRSDENMPPNSSRQTFEIEHRSRRSERSSNFSNYGASKRYTAVSSQQSDFSSSASSYSYYSEAIDSPHSEIERPPSPQFVTPVPLRHHRSRPLGSAPVVDRTYDERYREQYMSPYAEQQEALRRRSLNAAHQYDRMERYPSSQREKYSRRSHRESADSRYASRDRHHRRHERSSESYASSDGYSDSSSQSSYSSNTSSRSSYDSYYCSSRPSRHNDRSSRRSDRHERRKERHVYDDKHLRDRTSLRPKAEPREIDEREIEYNLQLRSPPTQPRIAPMSSSNHLSPIVFDVTSEVPETLRLVSDDTLDDQYLLVSPSSPQIPSSLSPTVLTPPVSSNAIVVYFEDTVDPPTSQKTLKFTHTTDDLNGAPSSTQPTDTTLTQTTPLSSQVQPKSNLTSRVASWVTHNLFGWN